MLVCALRVSPAARIAPNAASAASHCSPLSSLSYALTSELNVHSVGCIPAAFISSNAASAASHRPPLANAPMRALNVTSSG